MCMVKHESHPPPLPSTLSSLTWGHPPLQSRLLAPVCIHAHLLRDLTSPLSPQPWHGLLLSWHSVNIDQLNGQFLHNWYYIHLVLQFGFGTLKWGFPALGHMDGTYST